MYFRLGMQHLAQGGHQASVSHRGSRLLFSFPLLLFHQSFALAMPQATASNDTPLVLKNGLISHGMDRNGLSPAKHGRCIMDKTHTLVRQNVCSRGSYWFVIFCSWKGRCTQTCFKQWHIEHGRRCEWITEFKNRNGLMAGTSDWSGQISPALIQCLRWCKTEWAACTPCLKTEKLKYLKFANPLETGVGPTHKGLSPLVFVGHNALWIPDKAKKPFCTYNRDSACNELCAWQDGNEYLRIKWARLFSPLKRNRRVPAETLSRIWRMPGNL